MDVIIGGGIGGLMAAAGLASLGRRVAVFERKRVAGGRFTNIHHKGFTLSTGALHMLPHGSKGPTAAMLERLGVPVDIVDSTPQATILIGGKQYTEKQFQRMLTVGEKLRILLKNARIRRSIPSLCYSEYLEDVGSEILSRYADAFCRFVFSASSRRISLREALMATAYSRYYGGPGVIRGGCKSVIDALCEYISSHGGKIHTGCTVEGIAVSDAGVVEGVYVGGRLVPSEVVISDIGPRETASLLKDAPLEVLRAYEQSVAGVSASFGIKISFCSDASLIGHCGVMFTPECERIGGVVEVSAGDASLAPSGKHLFMSHQSVEGEGLGQARIKREIEAGICELESVFPDFSRDDILMVQTYLSEPVNRALQGYDVGVATPVGGLYLVGDGVKDGVEVEGIARSVDSLLNMLQISA
jgi:phytoene dehydrogenase-like protein